MDYNFEESLKEYDKELRNIDDLYTELKNHYDQVRLSKSHGSLTFVSHQTQNLISVKTLKSSLIKDRLATMLKLKELELKESKDNSSNNTVTDEISKQIYKMMIEGKNFNIESLINDPNKSETHIDEQNTDDLDNILEQRYSEIKSKKSNNEPTGKIDKVKYVCDMDKNIYAVDKDYNLLEDESIPNMLINFINKDDKIIAIDEITNTEIEIVSF